MKFERYLARWQEAGLIDAETAQRILAHEEARPNRPYVLYAASGLGALSIAIGLVSIVAANWGEIGATEKLALDLALLVGLAVAIFFTDRASRREPESLHGFAREALLFIYYGATLASIGLVAQIYQLGGELHHALLFWSAVTLPMVLFAHTRLLFGTVLIALQATAMTWLVSLTSGGLRGREGELIQITGVATLPLLLLGLSMIPALQRRRTELCETAAGLGIIEWLFVASISQFVWYVRGRYAHVDHGLLYAALPVLLSVGLAFFIPRSAELDGKGRRGLQALLLYGPIFGYLPLLVPHHEVGLVGAVGFLLLWALVGWTALRLGRVDLFNLATAFLALRLLGIYFELFGGLLNTGIGLLSGGVVTLLLAWIWVRVRRKKPQSVPAEPEKPVAAEKPVEPAKPSEFEKPVEGEKHD